MYDATTAALAEVRRLADLLRHVALNRSAETL